MLSMTGLADINQLSHDEIHCWLIDCATIGAWAFAMAEATLSQEELGRAGSFYFASDHRLYVAAHVALRFLLAKHVRKTPREIGIIAGPFGRPILQKYIDASLHFNLSHSGQLAMIAIGLDTPVGIDVETVRDFAELDMVARANFARQEIEAFDKCCPADRANAFTTIWTRKEAVVKAQGVGLAYPLDEFETGNPHKPPQLSSHCLDFANWTIADVPVPVGYCACVAAPSSMRQISLHEFSIN